MTKEKKLGEIATRISMASISPILEREQAFQKMLDDHDWYYMYSDDPKVFDRGLAAEKAILKQAQEWGTRYIDWYKSRQQKLF